jgi:hypothetical protein
MRRTKAWWATLTKEERCRLVALESGANYHGSGWNLPEGYADCGMCSTPTSCGGLCGYCLNELIALVKKADDAVLHTREGKL